MFPAGSAATPYTATGDPGKEMLVATPGIKAGSGARPMPESKVELTGWLLPSVSCAALPRRPANLGAKVMLTVHVPALTAPVQVLPGANAKSGFCEPPVSTLIAPSVVLVKTL